MNGMKKLGLGAMLAATVITTAAPAEAQRWRRYDRGRGGGDVAAGAIIGGVLGLGLGAAIASGNRGGRGYYDDGYYYGPRPRVRSYYYAPPPPPPVVVYRGYDRGYYGGGGYYGPPRGYYGGPRGYYGW